MAWNDTQSDSDNITHTEWNSMVGCILQISSNALGASSNALHSGTTHDYSFISSKDGTTDVTAAELEELTDNSETTLHSHAIDQGSLLQVTSSQALHSGTTHDYAFISSKDGGTDVTAAELEELTDGSETSLHTHAAGASAPGGSQTANIGSDYTYGYSGALFVSSQKISGGTIIGTWAGDSIDYDLIPMDVVSSNSLISSNIAGGTYQYNAVSSQKISGNAIVSQTTKAKTYLSGQGVYSNFVSGNNTNLRSEYMIAIWAEENSSLGNNTYEWAFGNGSNCPSNDGVTIYVPTGYECHIIAMTATTNDAAGSSVIEANINGSLQGSNCNVTISGRSGVNDSFTPVSISSGDRLTFRTTTAGTNSSPSIVCAWLRYRPT